MQDVVLAALVPVVDTHLQQCEEFCSLFKEAKMEDGYEVQDLRSVGGGRYQKEHEEENPAEPWGDEPRTVADTFQH